MALVSAGGLAALALAAVIIQGGSTGGQEPSRLVSSHRIEKSEAPPEVQPAPPERPVVVPVKKAVPPDVLAKDMPIVEISAETKRVVDRSVPGTSDGPGSVWLPTDSMKRTDPNRKTPTPEAVKGPGPVAEIPVPNPTPALPPFRPDLDAGEAEEEREDPGFNPLREETIGKQAAETPDDALAHPPGQAFRFRWEPVRADLPVYVPTDYQPQPPPPVMVYFHGTNGRPSVGPFVAASGGQGFVIVGQTYLKRGLFEGNAAEVNREWTNTKQMLDALSKEVPFDRKRIYVGGFSKGGWVTSLILELHPDEIAGAWIGGAGKIPLQRPTYTRSRTPKPVYIGVGETDPNRIASLAAIDHFTRLNSQVTYDEFPGIGHSCTVTPRMRDWFHAERLRGTGHLPTTANEKLNVGPNLHTDPWERYRSLAGLRQCPWYHLAEAGPRQAVERALAELKRDPKVVPQLRAKAAYERIHQKEIAMSNRSISGRTLAEARAKELKRRSDMLDEYRRFIKEHPGTFHAGKAEGDVSRVEAHVRFLKSR